MKIGLEVRHGLDWSEIANNIGYTNPNPNTNPNTNPNPNPNPDWSEFGDNIG